MSLRHKFNLVLAGVLRSLMLLVPVTHHPDEIYQYWEPAYRLLTGDGIVAWEWREGIRGWLLPTLLAIPMALGRAVGGSADTVAVGGSADTAAASATAVARPMPDEAPVMNAVFIFVVSCSLSVARC